MFTVPAGLTEEQANALIQRYINLSRCWNDGLGLIVPPPVATALRARGFTEGFAEQEPVSQ